jgi:hypothetical protein
MKRFILSALFFIALLSIWHLLVLAIETAASATAAGTGRKNGWRDPLTSAHPRDTPRLSCFRKILILPNFGFGE